MPWRERIFRALLFCYPAEFRYGYASEMTQLFRDRLREQPSLVLWLDLIADTVITAFQEHLHMVIHDIRYALRALRKSPVFAAAAVLTLALGIGANTAVFSVVNAVMLRPLPFGEPARLVQVAEKNEKLNLPSFGASVLNYLSWKEQSQSFEQLGAIGAGIFNLTGRGEPEQFPGAAISPSLLPLLGIQPVAGRTFREGEDKPSAAPVVLIGEGLWKRRFGGNSSIVGKSVTLNGIDYTVAGIAPASLAVLTAGDLWVPLTIDPGREIRLNHVITVVGRLRRGVTIEQAQAEMDLVSRRVGRQFPEVKDWGIRLISFYHWFVSDQLRTALLVLLAAVGLVLLIACANVANLLLSRAVSRQKEIAVRIAMGAGRGRLLRQLLTESLLLSVLGGGAGLLAARWAVGFMNGNLPQGVLPIPEVPVDSTVLWFALAVTLATGLLFGAAPAWHATRSDLNAVLKQAGRSSSGGARPLVRNALVAGELALATVLLIGAGLLTQSLMRLQQVHLGFQPQALLTFQISPPPALYPGARAWNLYRELLDSLAALPGVRGAAVSSGLPFGGGAYTTSPTRTSGKSALPAGAAIPVDWRSVSPDYFRTMQIPLLRGRYFTGQDGPSAPLTAIVSQETAARFWGADEPLGREIITAGDRHFTIVGVVGGVRNVALRRDLAPAMYFSAAVRLWPLMDVVVRTDDKPEAVLTAVRQRLRALDPELPMNNVRTMDQWISASAAQPRLNAVLLLVFAWVALLIAAIGIYGVLSYSVSQRTREIGLRMAIGAQPSGVLRLIVRQGMTVAMAGIAAGLVAALGVSRVLAALLYGIQPRDPATFLSVAAVLAVVALFACYIPARRAARLDPVIALS
jgi:putative ABC transport system permease protein